MTNHILLSPLEKRHQVNHSTQKILEHITAYQTPGTPFRHLQKITKTNNHNNLHTHRFHFFLLPQPHQLFTEQGVWPGFSTTQAQCPDSRNSKFWRFDSHQGIWPLGWLIENKSTSKLVIYHRVSFEALYNIFRGATSFRMEVSFFCLNELRVLLFCDFLLRVVV